MAREIGTRSLLVVGPGEGWQNGLDVLFQSSANDSASLIDNPRAGSLGLHRALFYNEQQGYLELFRPYALPQEEWIREAAEKLKRLL